jgi:ketosteroid isomerase-like protein
VIYPKEPSEGEKSVKIEKEKEEKASPQQVQAKKTAPSVAIKMVEPSLPTSRPKSSSESPPTPAPTELGHPRPVEKQKPASISKVSKKTPTIQSVSDSSISTKKDDQLLGAKLPASIATEEEIKKLFVHYVDRYNKKDIHGFLSLFSPRAIQNQKDGLEEIRRIYENFFYQSQELRYSVEDMKVEIYQNAVEVKARYEVDQMLRADGEKKIWKGRIQWMLVKEDGVLKIISLNYKHENTP